MAAPTIDESAQLPTDISRGAVGGPEFSTVLVISAGGSEQRIAQRIQGLYRFDLSHDMKTAAQAATIIAFFQARQGRFRGFRFKDWADYTATNEPLVYAGGPTLQLIKTYTSGGISRVRTIYKPVASPAMTMRKNGSSFALFTVDTTTGIVTLTAVAGPFAITAINQAVNATITTGVPYSGFGTTSKVYLSGIVGMTQLNGQTVEVASAPNNTHFSILTDTTGYTPYVSGGTVTLYYPVTDVFDWAGQYDVPVRFDDDRLQVTQQDVSYFDFSNLKLVELRG